MTVKRFTVIATPSDGWWSIEVPEIPGALSQGRSPQEVHFMAVDAISLILDIPRDQIGVDIEYRSESIATA